MILGKFTVDDFAEIASDEFVTVSNNDEVMLCNAFSTTARNPLFEQFLAHNYPEITVMGYCPFQKMPYNMVRHLTLELAFKKVLGLGVPTYAETLLIAAHFVGVICLTQVKCEAGKCP